MKKMLAGLLLFVMSLSVPAGAQNLPNRYDSHAIGHVGFSLNSGSTNYFGQIFNSNSSVGEWSLGYGLSRADNGNAALTWDANGKVRIFGDFVPQRLTTTTVSISNLAVGSLFEAVDSQGNFLALCVSTGGVGGSVLSNDGITPCYGTTLEPLNPVPSLGLAGNYAALSAADGGGGAVTCTDSTINGDIGTSGLIGSITKTNCTHNGSDFASVSAQTIADFDTAYGRFLARPCDQILTGTLAGITLAPGTYCFSAGAAPTGVLTLNGPSNGVWVFKTGTSLAATNFTVTMAGGAIPCNVHWVTGTSFASTTSDFKGNVLAGTSFASTGAGGLFKGHALAKAGVTFTTTIANTCP